MLILSNYYNFLLILMNFYHLKLILNLFIRVQEWYKLSHCRLQWLKRPTAAYVSYLKHLKPIVLVLGAPIFYCMKKNV